MIELRKIAITDDNMKECVELEVMPKQRGFVAPNLSSLAEAYYENKCGRNAVPYAIYADNVMVGFIMYGYIKCEDDDTYGEDCYFFWRFMIDKNHQGKGYGKQAMAQLLDEIKTMPSGAVDYIYTSYEPTNTVAKKLYESFGFVETGQVDDGELVARLAV